MKKLAFFLLFTIAGFANPFVLQNNTSHPAKGSKIALQWASSAKEVEMGNQALRSGSPLDPATLHTLGQTGKMRLTSPTSAKYFRVLVWSHGKGEPDLHTNWVELVPGKTYRLEADHLVPSVLLSGMGC